VGNGAGQKVEMDLGAAGVVNAENKAIIQQLVIPVRSSYDIRAVCTLRNLNVLPIFCMLWTLRDTCLCILDVILGSEQSRYNFHRDSQ
jgi:hypothetical protein